MAARKDLPVGTLDAILAAKDLKEKTVPVPEWGVSVKIRSLSRAEVLAISNVEDDGTERANVLALVGGMVEPEVTEEQAEELLAAKSVEATNKVLTAILEASGLAAGFPSG